MFSLMDELLTSMLFFMEKPHLSPEVKDYESPAIYKELLLDNLSCVGKVKLGEIISILENLL